MMRRRWAALAALTLAAAVTGWGFAATYATTSASGTLSGPYAVVFPAGASGAPAGRYGTVWSPQIKAHKNTAGTLSPGDLFVVTNPNNYDGALQVAVYLTNAGALASAFKYLNIQVGLWYAVGSGSGLTWSEYAQQTLSLSGAAIQFDVPASAFYNTGAGTGELSISVDGGDYDSTQTGTFTVDLAAQVHPETGNV